MDKAYLKEYSKSDGIADLNLIKFCRSEFDKISD